MKPQAVGSRGACFVFSANILVLKLRLKERESAPQMPIPSFTIDGVLPPFVGPNGPAGGAQDMTPYVVTAMEVVSTFGTTEERKTILRGWLQHRAALRAIGLDSGFQWLDGSFVEDKDPKDLDLVTFVNRPATIHDGTQFVRLMQANANLFIRPQVRASFSLDAFLIDLDASGEAIVNNTRYWLGLFSHRRGDSLWKGMLQVRLEDLADDAAALLALGPQPVIGGPAAGGNP